MLCEGALLIHFPTFLVFIGLEISDHCLTKEKLRTYRTFKDDMNTAAHLNSNLPKYERSLISQLRLGVLPLRIETGRFTNLEVGDRLCELCDKNQVETEAHFLFECELYSDLRNNMSTALNTDFQNLNEPQKFELVFKHPHILGKYMSRAISTRKSKLYN